MNRLVLADMQLLPLSQQDMDIDVGLLSVLSKEAEHTRAKNVEDLDLDDYVQVCISLIIVPRAWAQVSR